MTAVPGRKVQLKFPRTVRENRVRLILLLALSSLFFALSMLALFNITLHSDILISCILTLTNAFLGYVFVERAFSLNISMSIILLMAGMAVRFVLTVVAIAAILLVTSVGMASFIGSFMVFYTISLIAEVYYINYKTDQLKLVKVPVRK